MRIGKFIDQFDSTEKCQRPIFFLVMVNSVSSEKIRIHSAIGNNISKENPTMWIEYENISYNQCISFNLSLSRKLGDAQNWHEFARNGIATTDNAQSHSVSGADNKYSSELNLTLELNVSKINLNWSFILTHFNSQFL